MYLSNIIHTNTYNMTNMVYLNWKSPNGTTGKGCIITQKEGDAWIIYLKDKFPDYTHWISFD